MTHPRLFLIGIVSLSTAAAWLWAQHNATPTVSGPTQVEVEIQHIGKLKLELFDQDKPVSVRNFLQYIKQGAYDKSFIHSASSNHVLQGGSLQLLDFSGGSQAIGPLEEFAPVPSEFGSGRLIRNQRGTIALTHDNGDPNTATCHWFINLADNPQHDQPDTNGSYTVVGRVVSGIELLDKMNPGSTSNAITVLNMGGWLEETPVRPGVTTNNVNYGDLLKTRFNIVALNKAMAQLPPLKQAAPPASPVPADFVCKHLVFHGMVVDEKTNALAGAEIDVYATTYTAASGQRSEQMHFRSEANGRFTINIPNGQSLSVTKVSRGTNYHEALSQTFKYGLVRDWEKHKPDANAPVRFVLHRKLPDESLFGFEHWYPTPKAGEPVRVDFSTGHVVKEGGDLIVSIECLKPFISGVRVPWKLSVQVVEGGLFQVQAERLSHLYQAPETGYIPGFVVEHQPGDADWRSQHDAIYFVRSRNGQEHAKIRFGSVLSSDERDPAFQLRAIVNTNASRNLQHDERKLHVF